MADQPATKTERRMHAREVAREQREAQRRRERRNKLFLQGGLAVGILAVVAIVALVVVNGVSGGARPANMASDGIRFSGTDGALTAVTADADAEGAPTPYGNDPETVDIVTYVDYLCPYCNQFETANSAQIEEWVASGAATIEYRPISILDRLSEGTEYSTRAANAVACVANTEPEAVPAFNTALFANQPAEQTEGLTDDELIALAAQSGVTADISACVTGGEFERFIGEATDRALAGEALPEDSEIETVASTPTVLVDGVSYTDYLEANNLSLTDAQVFADFVAENGDVSVE